MIKILCPQSKFISSLLIISLNTFSQNVVTVTDCNLNGWVRQTPGTTTLTFKNQPANPILGKGSLEFSDPANGNLVIVRFRNTNYNGVLLSSITELGFSSFVETRENDYDAQFVVLQIDLNGDGKTDNFLEFGTQYQSSPWQNGIAPDQGKVVTGSWQTWDMLHGVYWLGPDIDPEHGGAVFNLATYISQHPTAKIVNDPATGGGGIRLAGGSLTGQNFKSYADNFRIGVNGVTTIYDFEYTTANAGKDKNVIYGFGSNCTTLTGVAVGGVAPYTYAWRPGGSTPNDASTEVCPTATTTYTLTVTDSKGCIRTDDVTVNVNDVRCGSKMDKVKVCHKGEEICISPDAVPGHLNHGDVLGSCSSELLTRSNNNVEKEMLDQALQFKLSNYPNPFNGTTRIAYEMPADGNVSLKVYDLTGKEITTLVSGNKKQGKYSIDFASARLKAGVYYYKITVSSAEKVFTQTNKMVVVH